MKSIRVSPAALAVARSVNQYAVCDLDVTATAERIDEELAPALPLLKKLESSLEMGSTVLTDLNRVQRNLLEIDLANVRSALHRLSPMNQEIQDHE